MLGLRHRLLWILVPWVLPAVLPAADDLSDRLRVPAGFTVERVAGAPEIQFPMFATWDDQGRLYVAESSGGDLYEELRAQTRRCRISRLEDRNGDGRFDHVEVFVDGLVFPMGLVWREGRLYVADPPDLVAFVDHDDDGRADERLVILSGFGHRDNGSLHGLIFGPDDRLYMTMGNPDGYRLRRADGTFLEGTNGALIRALADGSHPEVVARGFTNLVEVVFLPDGSIIGTDNFFQEPRGGFRDALVHLVEGGLYPQNSYEDATHHVVTGEELPPVTLLPATGISGVMRYRGSMFPEAMRGDLFSAQHNTRLVARHILSRQGSTWVSRDEDFLTSDDPDFHPSDVLEDADGSLLVIDTGGWYVQHCPTGKIQPSRAPGGIYRVRFTPAPAGPSDPWGRALAWADAPEPELVARLADPRPMVQDRAVSELARRGDRAVPSIATWLKTRDDQEAQQRALWLLARLPGRESLEILHEFLHRDEPDLVMVAARALALRGDRTCEPRLRDLLAGPDAAVRLVAAEALVHCGSAASLDALWTTLGEEPDPFLEHALVYAISRHASALDLEKALDLPDPQAQRVALLLLDQPPHESLDREALVARTGAADDRLRQTALDILQRHPEWADHALALIRGWIGASALTAEQQQSLRAMVLAFQEREAVAVLVARAVAGDDAGVSGERRRLLLDAMSQSLSANLPASWSRAIGRALEDRDPSIRAAAARAAATLALDEHISKLASMIDDASIDDGLRMELLRAVVRSRPRLSEGTFLWLLDRFEDEGRPIDQLAAAEVLARTHLSADQIDRLLARARDNVLISPSLLMPLLERSAAEEQTATAIVDYLGARVASGWRPSEAELAGLVAKLSPSAHQDASRLLKQVRTHQEQLVQELAEFLPLIDGGDAERGQTVFFSDAATCAACHRIDDQGGQIGPDLTGIGASRAGRDLVESIIFPSSTIAQGYESYLIYTDDGQVYSGIIDRQTPDVVVLLDSARQEHRIARESIEEMQRQSTSIMPDGFGHSLTRDQLRDLLAFLQSLK